MCLRRRSCHGERGPRQSIVEEGEGDGRIVDGKHIEKGEGEGRIVDGKHIEEEREMGTEREMVCCGDVCTHLRVCDLRRRRQELPGCHLGTN